MDKTSWLDDPHCTTEINSVPILATTLKGLKMIAADYRKKVMRPKWRTTQFQYVVVVARVLSIAPQFIISDNTDTLIHEIERKPTAPQVLIRHQYYCFIFDITPYSSDGLAIISIQSISSIEIAAHYA